MHTGVYFLHAVQALTGIVRILYNWPRNHENNLFKYMTTEPVQSCVGEGRKTTKWERDYPRKGQGSADGSFAL